MANNNNDKQQNNQSSNNSGNQGGGRGFAGMDKERQREIASNGGKAAHQSGNAHQFTSEEAREAGRKGGLQRSSNASDAAQEDNSTKNTSSDAETADWDSNM
jgi:uncharacterized protein